jgi:hypothetical protein
MGPGNPLPGFETDETLYQIPLTDLVMDAIHILKYRVPGDRWGSQKLQPCIIAAGRIQDEIHRLNITDALDRHYYEKFIELMGLSLSMLPWVERVITFVDRGD